MSWFNCRTLPVLLVALASTVLLTFADHPAFAGVPLTPTRFDDPAPDGCEPNDCSLREAVMAANSSSGEDTIALAAGAYTLTIPGLEEFAGATGDLNVKSAVAIIGAGATTTTIDAGGIDRAIFVSESGDLTVSQLTIQGGETATNGGGILNVGSLTVRDSVLRNNTADSGGAIASGSGNGRLVIERTTLTGNTGDGGGLFLADPGSQATIRDSTISDNAGIVYSGGLHVQSGVVVTLTNVTISDNSAPAPSAMTVTADAQVTLTNVTVAENQSTTQFAVAIANYATLVMQNTIIQDADRGCAGDGTFQSLGHNVSSDGSCNLAAAGDLPSTDPLLGPLADNGGSTLTRALLVGSPAIDAGDDDGCPVTDQRGFGRVGICDIGAFELDGSPVTVKQGDVNCDDEVNAVDALVILRSIAGLPTTAQCVDMAGDVNCDSNRTSVDALGVLRYVAGLPVNQNEPCADIGTPV